MTGQPQPVPAADMPVEADSEPDRPTRSTVTAVAGDGRAPARQRALFVMTTSFAVSIAVSRTLNYIRERRRAMPHVRNLGRVLAQAPADNSVRVHHFLPGIAIGFTSGGVALLTRAGAPEQALSLPFGVGLALTTDELRLLIGRNNPYWGGEHFALAQGAIASVASVCLAVSILRRGRGPGDGQA